MNIFRTERMTAERLRAEHLDELCRMHRDPVGMATLGGVRSDEETRQFLQRNLDHWDRHGYGLWVFRDPAAGRFVGRGGLRHVEVEGKDEVEVAYALLAEFWGRGLATEMARALVQLAFERLHLKDLICFTLPTNRASNHVMEKVGFLYERTGTFANLPHIFYRLTNPRGAGSRDSLSEPEA